MNKVYGVIFNDIDKKYYYLGDEEFAEGSLVIVNTERGMQLVKVVQVIDKISEEITDKIERLATEEEYEQYLENLKDAINTATMHVGMKDYKTVLKLLVKNDDNIYFTADGRVDFRELAKKLASIYHTRIELRQIGARDKAKEIGGIGVCGGELCCLRFLKKMDTISMNMAKNQNLALNPSKINGAEAAKKLPKVGDKIKTRSGDAQVLSVDIINHRGKILLDGERINYDFESEE